MPLPLDTSALDALIDQKSWPRILEVLGEKSWEKTAAQWLPHVQSRLAATIPDRERLWPQEWSTKKRAPAATPIVRTLKLPPRTQGAMQKLADQLQALDATTMPPLTHFIVTDFPRKDPVEISAAHAQLLWDKLSLTPLRYVELHRGSQNAPLFDALRTTDALRRVEELELRQVPRDFLTALAAAPALDALRVLRVDLHSAGTLDAAAFARSFAPRLERLQLFQWGGWIQSLDPEGALWSVPWPRLEKLSLTFVELTPDSLHGLFTAAPELSDLHLRRCAVPRDAIARLRDLAPPRALRQLGLSGCELSDSELAALLQQPACASLTRLWLDDPTDAGPATAAAIEALPQLTGLSVTGRPMPDSAAWTELLERFRA